VAAPAGAHIDLPWSQGDDVSFAEFLVKYCADVSPEAKDQAVAYVEGFNAANKDVISAPWLAQSVQAVADERSFRLRDGYDRVVQWLADGLQPGTQVRLGTAAAEVTWRPGRVEVQLAVRGDRHHRRAERSADPREFAIRWLATERRPSGKAGYGERHDAAVSLLASTGIHRAKPAAGVRLRFAASRLP
jgi:hypothetical protein